ncbi:MAG: HPr kinase/phosphatase C-terminal domain-containing protein [Rhodospirillaceae bacterium]|nr:HPr kinase/phosphatase C-terminal domain-containing protein [Rhodospirillaceae bacterium]
MTLTHATCVALGDIGILIRGPSGAGKSDLALRLLDGGATLVSDDYCHLAVDANHLVAHAPEAISGKMEVRGYGIINIAHKTPVRIGLVVDLSPKEQIPRLPETQTCVVEGIKVIRLDIDPDTPSAAAKIRLITQMIATTGNENPTTKTDTQ